MSQWDDGFLKITIFRIRRTLPMNNDIKVSLEMINQFMLAK